MEVNFDGPTTILVAIDGSETSLRAAAYAAGMARRQGARIVCLYVRSAGSLSRLAPAVAGPLQEAQDAVANELRETLRANAPRLGITADFVERSGSPGNEITRLADELRVDAVVVGASMQAGHRFIGSIAAHLVRTARWPVIVVP